MKKIITTLVLCSLAVCAFAQSNNISSTKTLSGPDANGQYTLTLESFVTGVTSTIVTADPSDIVLVLDVSGSMDKTLSDYYPLDKTSYSYDSYGSSTLYYKHTNGNYYQVSRTADRAGIFSSTTYYRLRYRVGTTYWYLTNNGPSTSAPTNVTNSGREIFNGVLYSNTRMAALRVAVYDFIDQIQNNAYFDQDGNSRGTALDNQIAIVKFANEAYYGSEASLTEGDHKNAPYNGQTDSDWNYTEVVKNFTSVSDAGVNALKTAIRNLDPGGGTAAHYGMRKAQLLVESLPASRTSKKTVVLFTDGAPGMSGYDSGFADYAVQYAYAIKHTDGATVYTIGLFDSHDTDTDNYMNYVSSNFPNAENLSTPGTSSETKYYQPSTGMNLSSIFSDIASQSGSAGNTSVTSTSIAHDVVTSSFSLPQGTSTSQIKTYTYDCYGEANGVLLFNNKQPVTTSVSIVKNADGTTTVDVTGFDYSANWCGDRGTNEFDGKKLSIEIPISIDDSSVGGPGVTTNTTDSGLYIPDENGEPYLASNFPVPPQGVTSPINLWIKKTGLLNGETAEFIIHRRFVEAEDVESSYTYFATVLLTGNGSTTLEGAPMVKLIGLDPAYVYRISESSWGWTYTNTENANTTGGSVQYSTDLRTNPFVFGNTKDNSVKNAEHTVVNDFN